MQDEPTVNIRIRWGLVAASVPFEFSALWAWATEDALTLMGQETDPFFVVVALSCLGLGFLGYGAGPWAGSQLTSWWSRDKDRFAGMVGDVRRTRDAFRSAQRLTAEAGTGKIVARVSDVDTVAEYRARLEQLRVYFGVHAVPSPRDFADLIDFMERRDLS